jgi:hypothetical protein
MTKACAVCQRTAVKDGNKFWPLCSERCQLVDLGKWLGEEYRIEGQPSEDAAAQVLDAIEADEAAADEAERKR